MIRQGMSTYTKHLIWRSFSISLFVWLTILCLDFTVSFVTALENLSDGISFLSLLLTTMLEQPRKGLQYLETSMLIGNLIFLRSLGFAPVKIVLIAGIGPLLLSFILVNLDEFVFISLTDKSNLSQKISIEANQLDQGAYSWQLNEQNLIGVQNLDTNQITGVQLIEFNESGEVIRAERLASGQLKGNQLIVQSLGNASPVTRVFPFLLKPLLDRKSLERSSLRSLLNLKKSYATDNSKSDLRLIESAIYAKIFLPISAIGIIFFAGSLMFGLVRSGGIGRQVMFGIFFGLLFDLTKDLFVASFLTYQWPIVLAYLLPILGLALGGWAGYRRL